MINIESVLISIDNKYIENIKKRYKNKNELPIIYLTKHSIIRYCERVIGIRKGICIDIQTKGYRPYKGIRPIKKVRYKLATIQSKNEKIYAYIPKNLQNEGKIYLKIP